jgi:hypothetical protein
MRLAVVAAAVALLAGPSPARAAPDPPATRVVVLGVGHSGVQFAAPGLQPAAFRAFIDRVKPDDICIERSPEELARGDYYEFTFEQQDIVVPYARERRIPVHPIDWLPRPEDERLGFGGTTDDPPLIRPARGYMSFEAVRPAQLTWRLLFAETNFNYGRDFADTPAPKARHDYARRLFMYRTFMQAMRIANVAKQRPGGTVLVFVGAMHKYDIEQILGDEPGIVVVKPSTFGEPPEAEVRRGVRARDRFMIATFNLLGLQSRQSVDWTWVRQIVGELAPAGGHEVQLLAIRLDYLTRKLAPADALARLEALERAIPAGTAFQWTGVKDRARLDSAFDPFGNLTLKQRVSLEIARVARRLGQDAKVQQLEEQLRNQLTAAQAAQLRAYWKPYVIDD